MEYKNMYPDLFDDTDIDKWKTRNIRKEFLSYEWDMMVQEVAPDVFEIPFFNVSFCDNLVSILKTINWDQVNRWGTPVYSNNLKTFNLEKVMTHLVHDYIFSIVQNNLLCSYCIVLCKNGILQ